MKSIESRVANILSSWVDDGVGSLAHLRSLITKEMESLVLDVETDIYGSGAVLVLMDEKKEKLLVDELAAGKITLAEVREVLGLPFIEGSDVYLTKDMKKVEDAG